MPGQPHHVVAVARFAGGVRQAVVELAGRAEMLAFGIAADDVAVVFGHRLVEEARRGGMGRISGQLVQPGKTDQLGDLGVGVKPRQDVPLLGQRVEHGLVAKLFGDVQPAPVAGDRIRLGEGFVDAAMFGTEQGLHLLVAEPLDDGRQVIGHAEQYRQSPGIACEPVRVDQPGLHLVPGVDGYPAAVEVEALGADVAAANLFKDDLAVDRLAVAIDHRAADVAVSMGRLDPRQLGQRMVELRGKRRIGAVGKQDRAGRQPVTQGVARDPRRFPAAVALAFRRQAGELVKIVQQPVGIERQQVAAVRLDMVSEDRRLELDETGRDGGRLDDRGGGSGQDRVAQREQARARENGAAGRSEMPDSGSHRLSQACPIAAPDIV